MENGFLVAYASLTHRSLAIIPNSFHRTTKQRLFTARLFFLCLWLFVDEGITVRVGAAKVVRGGVSAYITIDARRVDVIGSTNVFFYAFVSVRQIVNNSPRKFGSRRATKHAVNRDGSAPLFASMFVAVHEHYGWVISSGLTYSSNCSPVK